MATICLSRGYVAEIDDSDFAAISPWKWSVQVCRNTCYARRSDAGEDGRRVHIYMHRQILAAPAELDVDHADHNGLNNRRSNLEAVTHAQNLWNPADDQRNGVYWHIQSSRWRARIRYLGRLLHIGGFGTEGEAVRAREFVSAVLRARDARPDFDPLRLPPTIRALVLAKLQG